MLYFLIWVGGFILASLIGAAVHRAITSRDPDTLSLIHKNKALEIKADHYEQILLRIAADDVGDVQLEARLALEQAKKIYRNNSAIGEL